MRSKRSIGESDDDCEEVPAKKKGRSKNIYGVIQQKWYNSQMPKNSLEALKMAGKLVEADARELVFSHNREAIMHLIKKAESIYNFLEGFYEDPLHLQGQFQHLTETNISDIIRKGLVGHLGWIYLIFF